jgi:hypothetical protein
MRLLAALLMLAGCGGPPEEVCVADGAQATTYRLTSMTLPGLPGTYALDLNGDGQGDNALGGIISIMTQGGFGAQGYVDAAFADGSEAFALDLFQDERGALSATLGETAAGHRAGFFCHPLSYGEELVSYRGAKVPVELDFTLTFAAYVRVTLTAAALVLSLDGNGMLHGQLNGAVRAREVRQSVIPGIAQLMTQKLQANPDAPESENLRSFFDIGDGQGGPCADLDGSFSQPKDGLVGDCEVANSVIAQSVLVADVDLFDDDGHYAPNLENTRKDSLSVGVGFTAQAVP